MIYIKNDRSVFPNNVKVSNQYENETRTIQFDLSDVQFTGNTYLICKYQNNQDFYAPLLLDSNFSIPVETFLSAQAGTYSCVIAISTATIDENYDFSTDNPLFVSNIFTLTVDANFLTGTSTSWQLTPAAQNYFDQLIALVEKVQSDLDRGAFVGNGIQSITKISTSGLVDTYQITFTNRSTFEYQVTNGQNGQTPTITILDGNGNLIQQGYMTTQDNLLINSDFRSGIINQQGETQYVHSSGARTYGIDCWYVTGENSSMAINDKFLSLNLHNNGDFGCVVNIEKENEKYLTYTIMRNLHKAKSITFDTSTMNIGQDYFFNIDENIKLVIYFWDTDYKKTWLYIKYNGVLNIDFMKLEKGNQFTGMPAWDRSSELIKCMPYYQKNTTHKLYGQTNIIKLLQKRIL